MEREKMLSFYVIGIQVKSFGRKPVDQYHLVQILLVFFRFLDYCIGRNLWCQIVENENLKPQVKEPLWNWFSRARNFEQLQLFNWSRCWPPASLQSLPCAIHHWKFKVDLVCAKFLGICNLLKKDFNCLFRIQIFITKNARYVCNVGVCNVLNSQRCVFLVLHHLSNKFPL